MSKYTTTIRNWCESEYQKLYPDEDIPANPEWVIDEVKGRIINFDFPSINGQIQTFRDEIRAKILRHFYFREIGFETVGMFRQRLNDKMQTIMPEIVELYEFKINEGQKIFSLYDTYEKREVDEETEGEKSTKKPKARVLKSSPAKIG